MGDQTERPVTHYITCSIFYYRTEQLYPVMRPGDLRTKYLFPSISAAQLYPR